MCFCMRYDTFGSECGNVTIVVRYVYSNGKHSRSIIISNVLLDVNKIARNTSTVHLTLRDPVPMRDIPLRTCVISAGASILFRLSNLPPINGNIKVSISIYCANLIYGILLLNAFSVLSLFSVFLPTNYCSSLSLSLLLLLHNPHRWRRQSLVDFSKTGTLRLFTLRLKNNAFSSARNKKRLFCYSAFHFSMFAVS